VRAIIVDAFTRSPGSGNRAGIIPDAAPLDTGFDLGAFQMSEPSALETPSTGWSLDSLDVAPHEPTRDVALETLEQWLTAVRIDRANRGRPTRS